MNQAAPATTPGASLLPDSTALFTTAHLVWIALFAVAALLAILWGARLKHRRTLAAREIAEHNAELAAPAPAAPPPATPATAAPTTTPTPVAVTAPPPAPVPTAPAAAAGGDPGAANGPVTQLKGLGPKVAARLAELDITTVGQIAALTDDEAAALDAQLGPFRGRMTRDRWLEQARFLAAGDKAGFEAVFGRL